MKTNNNNISAPAKQLPGLFSLLKQYKFLIALLIMLGLAGNALNLAIPQIISHSIDTYTHGAFSPERVVIEFALVAFGMLVFTYGQAIVQTYASERAARDLRDTLSAKISRQSYEFVEKIGSAKLLTNLTSDADSVKMFVSMAIASIVSSLFLIVGSSALLLLLNWKLALAVLVIIPLIGGIFFFVLRKMRSLFLHSREVIDWLNKVINESILGAALVRVLHSEHNEFEKFTKANSDARDNGLGIVRLFSILIPVITLVASLATVVVLVFGGHLVIGGNMTIGDFAAFNSYIMILIFPIMMLGFMSNLIARAQVSYTRIQEVLAAPEQEEQGKLLGPLGGNIAVKNLSLKIGEHPILKNISFEVKPKTKTAIIGPTAAGKTQLLHLLIGLISPTEGEILFDGKPLSEYNTESFHESVGLVFQDSVIFNLTLRENIAFNQKVSDEDLAKAVRAAELQDFIDGLPKGLETSVSERGMSLSGGQKQRIMLARALALRPNILLLDDFTARVDTKTEKKIFQNIETMYPDMTVLSVTQKVSSVLHYDNIILLMEGEKLAEGSHEKLMEMSPEYVQIYRTGQSAND
ncbi:MAG TPA: ABC transporter ATP-binding protein [Candidatus Paceibacterota bacterium]|nr:ABC transporter ATP-binding protein [Candidatus Paceibacterota bacterium]